MLFLRGFSHFVSHLSALLNVFSQPISICFPWNWYCSSAFPELLHGAAIKCQPLSHLMQPKTKGINPLLCFFLVILPGPGSFFYFLFGVWLCVRHSLFSAVKTHPEWSNNRVGRKNICEHQPQEPGSDFVLRIFCGSDWIFLANAVIPWGVTNSWEFLSSGSPRSKPPKFPAGLTFSGCA